MKIAKLTTMVLVLALVLALPVTAATDQNTYQVKANSREATSLQELSEAEKNELKEKIPDTYEAAVKKVPLKRRFLMWTYDGKNVMWGAYGNNFFYGKDNNGEKAWGIYGNHIFAGFYDGDFFWGRYYRGSCNGRWYAFGLFGLNLSRGEFVTFPRLMTAVSEPIE